MIKILFTLLVYLTFNTAQSIEIRIVHKIQNEIITNIDIKNEFKYLLALNNSLKELDKEKILNISNDSIIKEKIKKIELLNYYKIIEINREYSNIILKNIYSKLGLKSVNEFELYLKNYDLILSDVEKKITIDALWNELIIEKYSTQITINEEQIKKELKEKKDLQSREYRLSEIIFDVKNKEEIELKYKEVIKSINEIGFENSASIYSFSESSKIGGDIGWINENSLNNKIKNNINYLKMGEISKPIILSNGVLILKIINIKNSDIDFETELKKAINYEKNRQFNQYSKIYFNKVKKNLETDG
jgi:peptidyl-prolyl cis-trans isomerase SurA|tara:strand:+ start:6225 stop:7136 length:912 start_codon:yes stop_codon:yes gene_type:complete